MCVCGLNLSAEEWEEGRCGGWQRVAQTRSAASYAPRSLGALPGHTNVNGNCIPGPHCTNRHCIRRLTIRYFPHKKIMLRWNTVSRANTQRLPIIRSSHKNANTIFDSDANKQKGKDITCYGVTE